MKNQITAKIRTNIIYYTIAVVCATAFFVHEFVPKNSQYFINSLQKHKEAKSKRTKALNDLKTSQKGTELYTIYWNEKLNTDRLHSEYLKAENDEHFLAFDNFKQFLGEFGWAIGLFIYVLFNLSMSIIKKSKTKNGEMLIHGTLMVISLYFLYWCVLPQDYPKSYYIVGAILMSILIIVGTHKLIKIKDRYLVRIKRNNEILIKNIRKATRFIVQKVRKDWVPEDQNKKYSKQIIEFNDSLEPLE